MKDIVEDEQVMDLRLVVKTRYNQLIRGGFSDHTSFSASSVAATILPLSSRDKDEGLSFNGRPLDMVCWCR